jgi:hypothetical protein
VIVQPSPLEGYVVTNMMTAKNIQSPSVCIDEPAPALALDTCGHLFLVSIRQTLTCFCWVLLQVFMIDLSLCCAFLDKETGTHIEY